MLLIDDLLLLPISGFKFIFRTLQRIAEEQYTDDAPIKERLLELQLQLESGELSEKEYVKEEAQIMRQLRDLENHKRELAGLPPQSSGGLVFRPGGSAEAGAEVTMHHDSERKKHGLSD